MNNNHFGLLPSPDAVRDFDFNICCGAIISDDIELPERFELPINDWVKVYNQGNINACVGYGLAQAQEAHHSKITGESVSYSPGAIYGSEECREGYCGEGMYLRTAIKGVTKIGFVPSLVFDIVEEMPKMKEIVDQRPDLIEIGQPRKLKGYTSLKYAIRSKMIESMKRALYTYRVPLVVSSYNYFGGGHCFILYGWDDTINKRKKDNVCFLLRNSWGREYGDNGNYYIPVDDIDEVFLPIFEDFKLPFTDVNESDWYYNDVLKATFSGLVNGVSKDKFAPKENIIRGDVAITISRLMDKLQLSVNGFLNTLNQKGIETKPLVLLMPDSNFAFEDVHSSSYYYNEIGFVVANKLMNGIGDNLFEPTRSITRAEFATTVVRTYRYILELIKESVPSASLDVIRNETRVFSDVDSNQWYSEYISEVAALGLMNGDDTGLFRPDEMIIRAEATAVLNRLFKETDKLLESIR